MIIAAVFFMNKYQETVQCVFVQACFINRVRQL